MTVRHVIYIELYSELLRELLLNHDNTSDLTPEHHKLLVPKLLEHAIVHFWNKVAD